MDNEYNPTPGEDEDLYEDMDFSTYERPESETGRIKPLFGFRTVSFDVIDRTEDALVLEFWYEEESEPFFSALRDAGCEVSSGRLRLLGPNNCETGVPLHLELNCFNAIEWGYTSDPSNGVVLDGIPQDPERPPGDYADE